MIPWLRRAGLLAALAVAGCEGGDPADDDSAVPSDDDDVSDDDACTLGSLEPGPAPPELPQIELLVEEPSQATPGVLVTSLLSGQHRPVLIDTAGEYLWWGDAEEPGITVSRAALSRDRCAVLHLAETDGFVVEEDYVSRLHRTYLDGSGTETLEIDDVHHDFVELPDGTLAALARDYRLRDEVWVAGDKIVEIDPDGTTRDIWSVFDDADLVPRGSAGDEAVDWSHANAMDYDEAARAEIRFPESVDRWIGANQEYEEQAARAVWRAYREAPIHDETRADFDARRVRAGGKESPYTLKQVGEQPAGGWPLFIAMHGGGGVPKHVNDGQWEHMQIYYKDHPEVGGYLYLALRAPTDEWNGFYTGYMYPVIDALIRQQLLFSEVDPDKVFLMGYSHGGYGAFAIGQVMPDRFAAVHASAAAPTPGQGSPRNLRNTVFTHMVGEKDTAYGRAERNQEFAAEIEALKQAHPGAYPVSFEWQPGYGHGGLPDRDKIPSMYPAVRNPAPRQLDWVVTVPEIRDHFWLHLEDPAPGMELTASLEDNVLRIAGVGVDEVELRLSSRLVNVGRPLKVLVGGSEEATEHRLQPRAATLCRTLLARGNPAGASPVTVRLELSD